MIVRGTANDIQTNQQGHLSDAQRQQLQRMAMFRLAIVPTLILGLVMVGFGALGGDVLGWSVAGMGTYTLFSAWLRYQRKQKLEAGVVRPVEGVIEKLRTTPLPAFKYEVTINKKSYVLIAGLGHSPLHEGQTYRAFVLDGVARFGVIVAMEEL